MQFKIYGYWNVSAGNNIIIFYFKDYRFFDTKSNLENVYYHISYHKTLNFRLHMRFIFFQRDLHHMIRYEQIPSLYEPRIVVRMHTAKK
jgi:hypothetical protein